MLGAFFFLWGFCLRGDIPGDVGLQERRYEQRIGPSGDDGNCCCLPVSQLKPETQWSHRAVDVLVSYSLRLPLSAVCPSSLKIRGEHAGLSPVRASPQPSNIHGQPSCRISQVSSLSLSRSLSLFLCRQRGSFLFPSASIHDAPGRRGRLSVRDSRSRCVLLNVLGKSNVAGYTSAT